MSLKLSRAGPVLAGYDEAGFRTYLNGLNYANTQMIVRYTRRCLQVGVTVPDDVDGAFLDIAQGTRSKYRNALCRYHDYLATVRRAEATA